MCDNNFHAKFISAGGAGINIELAGIALGRVIWDAIPGWELAAFIL